MTVSQKFLKRPSVVTLISYVIAAYLWVCYNTSRKQVMMDDETLPYMNGQKNAIFAVWHGRMMMMPPLAPKHPRMHVLISLHRDGALIAKVNSHFGIGTINGSTSRGGSVAVIQMLKTLENGENVCITPDGPRGPNQTVTAGGIISVAQASGKPIIPVTFSASRCVRLKSWDKFMLVRPFGKLVFCLGAPTLIHGDPNLTPEAWASEIEREMNRLVDIADEAAK